MLSNRVPLKVFILGCIISACTLPGTAGCRFEPSGTGSNVLLIIIDTLRADHLGCYHYDRSTSPHIDKFAETGALFQNSYCQMPTTGPSHASIFTSLYPRRHGLLKNGWILSKSYPTLAEILERNGYTTAGIVSSFVLDPRFGFDRGFGEYDADFSALGASMGHNMAWEGVHVSGGFDQRANVTTAKALQWLRKHGKEKFFLFVHYFDPHSPYNPPEPHVQDFLRDGANTLDTAIAHYDGEIGFVDQEVGRLLDYLKEEGLDSRTLIIITSDHGEGLGQHEWMEHGMYLYEEQVRIPLLMSLPGVIPEKTVVNSTVEAIDIAPTILDILNVAPERSFSGQSVFPMILDPRNEADQIVFLERRYYEVPSYLGVKVRGQKFAVRRGNFKYIWAPQEETQELYDLFNDPTELSNMVDAYPDDSANMQAMIQQWEREQESEHPKPVQTIDEESRDKLRSLGYVD